MSALPTLVEIPVAEIGAGPKVRYERIDLDHVARLRLAIDALPAITVRQTSKGWALVDGQHRLSAHRFEERASISCQVVELDDAQALEAAVAANIAHGLHLTIAERTTAARRLVDDTDWSDRRIAESCGLDGKTVAGLRPTPRPTAEIPQLDGKRTGSDGKARPSTKADQQAQRDRIAAELAAKPDASLGEIAASTGASKMTVAAVKAKTSGTPAAPGAVEDDPTGGAPTPAPSVGSPLSAVPDAPEGVSAGDLQTWHPSDGQWAGTAEFQSSTAARDLARLMDRRLPRSDEDPAALAAGCPAAMRDGAIQAAANAAAWWADMAQALANPNPMEAVR